MITAYLAGWITLTLIVWLASLLTTLGFIKGLITDYSHSRYRYSVWLITLLPLAWWALPWPYRLYQMVRSMR